MNSTNKGEEFEKQVFLALEKTNPQNIEFFRGGADRGRDIVAIYECNGLTQTVIVECKSYNSSVKQKDISNSLNWAVATKPDLYYIWTDNYITPATKDYILLISKQYNLNVAWEEGNSVQKYIDACDDANKNSLFTSLRERIFKLLNIERLSNQLEYTSRILPSKHTLINRKDEKDILLEEHIHCFYLVGPSCVGKTQLAKNIAKQLYDKGTFVFWHRMLAQDSKSQLQNLLDSLGVFFSCVIKKNDLNEYLNNHGCFLTTSLINIIKGILSNYNCALFIDDIHKCNLKNHQFIELLIQLIDDKNCKLYFIGWFNIFNIHDYKIIGAIKFIDITPLSKQHIKEIVLNYDNTLTEEELDEIAARCDGLPGLAEIIPINREVHNFEGLLSYFRSLLLLMSGEEKAVLFSLAVSRSALYINDLETIGYGMACDQLTQKRLVSIEGNIIALHDMYKGYFMKIINLMPDETYDVLMYCAKNVPLIYIDMLYLFCKTKQISRYDTLLNKYFDYLLNMGYDVMLLGTLQEREIMNGTNILNIIMKKMILFERKSEYDIVGTYLNITKDIIDISSEDYYMWNYIHMRFKYFKCKFSEILNDFYNNVNSYKAYPIDLYLQVLFIVGRTYYVIGEIKIATLIYYYTFNLAMRNNLSKLAIKAIHRICIIEEKLRLYNDSKLTLSKLTDTRYFVSAKRQSFAYYRLSKCSLGTGNYDAAFDYNDKSMEIKTSLNAERGMVFSKKMYSQIYYKKGDTPMALYWGEEAFRQAYQLNLDKEIVATGIVYAEALLAGEQKEEAEKILRLCIDKSRSMCLSYRLTTIINLCDKYTLTNLKDAALYGLSVSKKFLCDISNLYIRNFEDVIEKNIDISKIEDLFTGKRALSSLLISIV